MATVPDAVPQEPLRRYSNAAVAFHWITVALVLTQAWLGRTFHHMDRGPERTEIFTWHKTVGVVILLLTLARLAYRWVNPPPPFTPDLPRWERLVATWNHRFFYLLLIVIPLLGLTAVSAAAEGPTTPLVGGIALPVIPGVGEGIGDLAGEAHGLLVWVLLAAIAIHASAALKNRFFDRRRVAGRMPPFGPPGGETPVIGQGARRAAPLEG